MKDCFIRCLCTNPITHCSRFNPNAEVCINCEEALINQTDKPDLSPVELGALYLILKDRLRTVEEDKLFVKLRDYYNTLQHGQLYESTPIPEGLVHQVLKDVTRGTTTLSGIRFMDTNCVIRWGVEDKYDPTNQLFNNNTSITGWMVVCGTLVQWGRVIGGREELYQL